MRHGKANPPNMRRRRYAHWLDKAAELLRTTGEAHTARWLIDYLPDDKHTPSSANSAAQKMRKDSRFDSFIGDTHDLRRSSYKTHFFFYNFEGEKHEEYMVD